MAHLGKDETERAVNTNGNKRAADVDRHLPILRFLRLPHECNYCRVVNGMTFTIPGRFKRRLLWVACRCGKRHYVCLECARQIGKSADNGSRHYYIAECARGWWPAHRHLFVGAEKKGEHDGATA